VERLSLKPNFKKVCSQLSGHRPFKGCHCYSDLATPVTSEPTNFFESFNAIVLNTVYTSSNGARKQLFACRRGECS